MTACTDVAVIGGGLHGLSAALQIARRGLRVMLLEGSWLGRHASSATAAGVRTLGRAWEEMPIALEAREMWHRIGEIVGDDCGFTPHGQIRIAETEQHLLALRERMAEGRRLGFSNEEMIDVPAMRKLVPAIAPHCMGALYADADGAADPHRTIRAFRDACLRAGVRILEGAAVRAIRRAGPAWRLSTPKGDFEAAQVVNCCGAWAAQVAALAGETIPLGHKASMMIVTERLEPFVRPVVSVEGRQLSFKQSSQGTLVIGGGLQGWADIRTQRSRVDFRKLAKGAQAAVDLFPSVKGVRITRTWTGIEAKTDDLLPVIGRSAIHEGFWHAFGFSGHGFQLVPIVGEIMADLVVTGRTGRHIAPFGVDRLTRSAA